MPSWCHVYGHQSSTCLAQSIEIENQENPFINAKSSNRILQVYLHSCRYARRSRYLVPPDFAP